MSDVQAVLVETHGSTALIRMNSPANRNALDPDMRAGLACAIEAVRTDEAVKAVVLTGTKGCFCAGGDVKGLVAMAEGPRDIFEGRSRIVGMHRWFEDLLDLEKPVIAAVSGPAFGAGLSLTLAADYVLAAPDATFCAVFARIGYVPDLLQMYLLPRLIGMRAAKDLVFSARTLDATEAEALGLVQRVVDDDVEGEALAFAARFEHAPSGALGIAKSVINRAFESDRAMIAQQESMAQAMCRESDFHQEAVRRFIAKQPPLYNWK